MIRTGDPPPVPADPKVIATALNANPRLLWQVRREIANLRVASPWLPFGPDYFERIELADGSRVASVRLELGVFVWQTSNHKGFDERVEKALRAADEALVGENPMWRLVR
jgi:hypothetical protein